MPGKGKPPPLAFSELTCQFAPESRQLTAGIDTAAKVIRYIGGKVELTLSDGAAGQVLSRRKPWGAKWAERIRHPHPFFDGGIIQVRQTPADCESGATYEILARNLATGTAAYAAVDFPPALKAWDGLARSQSGLSPLSELRTLSCYG